jgi:hypothetical protein
MRRINRRFIHEELYRDLSPIADKKIVICGCGAIGGNTAVHLAKMGLSNLTLIDDSVVKEWNLGTQPYRIQDLGAKKAIVLANDLYRITESCKAVPITKRLTEKNAPQLLGNADVVLDSFDNHKSRAAVQRTCLELKLSCLHAGMSGEGTGDLHWEEGYEVPQDVPLEDPCAYPLGLVLVNLTSALATELIVRFLLTGKKENYLVLRDALKIAPK